MSDQPSNPNIPPEHEVDRRATALVVNWLSLNWLVRPLALDYGLDYMIEGIDGGQPSGKVFYAQQKGTRGVSFNSKGNASWKLETRHLRYYFERLPAPVFLFVVDVEAGCGWFCHVQAELELLSDKLSKQKSVSLPLRLDNVIHNQARLLGALDKAVEFMREKYPGSLQAAFRSASSKHEEIDPNFALAKAEVSDRGTRYTLTPKRAFDFSINVPSASATSVLPKIHDLLNFGKSLRLSSDEVSFENFPLLEKSKSDGLKGSIHFKSARTTSCELTLSAQGKAGFSLPIKSQLSGGVEGGLLTGKLDGGPLGIELKIRRENLKEGGMTNIHLNWDLTEWIGQDLRSLAWLEPITMFWRALFDGRKIDAEITTSGNKLTSGKFNRVKAPEVFQLQHRFCEMLLNAREFALRKGIEIKFPEPSKLLEFDWEDIDIAHALIVEGVYKREAPNFRAQLTPAPDNDKLQKLLSDKESVHGWSKLVCRPYSIEVFGRTIEVCDAVCNVGPVTCKRAGVDKDGDGMVEVIGEAATTMELTRIDDPKLDPHTK